MARKKFFDHRGTDGSQPRDRVLRAGYASRLTGENIAFGPYRLRKRCPGGRKSRALRKHHGPAVPAHRRGTGDRPQRGSIYWVQDFGAPQPGR